MPIEMMPLAMTSAKLPGCRYCTLNKDFSGELKAAGLNCQYDQQGAIGRRYRRQDEIGTPFCITVDGDTAKDNCVTVRDRDSLLQDRVPVSRIVEEIVARLKA